MTFIMKTFSKSLLNWYQKNARALPWRKTNDPYKIWISEIMLQQTTVNAVIPYYQKWIKTFPKIEQVARASEQELLKMWQGLGYYRRVKNIHKAAKLICNDHNYKIPKNANVLKQLPGFGPYTTGAVLSIAYEVRIPIVDANVRRVIMRVLCKEGIADTTQDKAIYAFLEKVLPNKHMGDFNQALMELGAMICRSPSPQCLICPLKKLCKAYEKGKQEIIPETSKKIIKKINVVIGVIKSKNKYFIQKRPSHGLLGDLWEFPGGKIEKGETAQKALKRELKEEIDVELKSAKHLMDVVHYYTQFKVKLNVSACDVNPLPQTDATHKWVTLKEVNKFPMPSGSVKIVEKLKNP